ncbi:hypothetical protein CHS0354_002277 [Potamilus streckersoni]|uniref:RNA 2-O ribose methyltransferase substrate binding domain-containing protein n=1 Tax=Potamilus streckersoni TaxID=2493646 RepID=A0AAE0S3W1_9BIVA|nr:hypothetical protein CHS0354_002277 [Potamilus streckersoni]
MAASIKAWLVRFSLQNGYLLLKRHYAREYRRRLVRVIKPEDEVKMLKNAGMKIRDPKSDPYATASNLDITIQEQLKIQKDMAKSVKSAGIERIINKPSDASVQIEKQKSMAKFQYETLQAGDKTFGQIVLGARSKKNREKTGEILLDGKSLMLDALKAGATMKYLFFSSMDAIGNFPAKYLEGVKIIKVTYQDIKIWSDTQTPTGILGVFDMPKQGEALFMTPDPLPVSLICDKITDPGNMGTLLRSAAAVGCSRVFLTKGCVDVWGSKVLRAGAGSHFRVPIITDVTWDVIKSCLPSSCRVYLAETRRPSIGLLKKLQGDEESIEKFMGEESDFSDGEEGQITESEELVAHSDSYNETTKESDIDSDEEEEDSATKLKQYEKAPLSVSMYDKIDYTTDPVAIVVGDESIGVSPEARKLAFHFYGQCITVPITSGVYGLNSSVTGSIVLYEIKRQISSKQSTGMEKQSEQIQQAKQTDQISEKQTLQISEKPTKQREQISEKQAVQVSQKTTKQSVQISEKQAVQVSQKLAKERGKETKQSDKEKLDKKLKIDKQNIQTKEKKLKPK